MQKRTHLDSVTIIYLLENTAKKPAVLSVLRTPDALLTHSILHMPLREDVKLSLYQSRVQSL